MQIPSNESAKIVNTGKKPMGLVFQATGANPIWISPNQNQIDSTQPGNIPGDGFICRPGDIPVVIPQFIGVLWARAQVQDELFFMQFYLC